MRKLPIALLLLSLTTNAQNVIHPLWGSIFADGQFSAGEWDQAPTVDVPAGGGDMSQVAFAVDGWGLFLGFMGHLESNQLFPELLLDIDHDRTPDWNGDDRWFHVSATSCHHQGAYGVYDDCSPLPNNWSAHPNISPGPPMTDMVEIAIPWWYLLGITPQPGDTIGIAVVLTNTATSWNMWPAGASRLDPSTWGHLVFPGASAIAEGPSLRDVTIWPNPVVDRLTIETRAQGPMDITLFDAQGRTVHHHRSVGTGSPRIRMDHVQAGTYLLRLQNGDDTCVKLVQKL